MGSATNTAVAIMVATSAILLSGCDGLVDPPPGLRIHVINNTDVDLKVRNMATRIGVVRAGSDDRVRTGTAAADCLASGVTATSEDGAWVATMEGPICHDDEWVIEQSDLEPVPAPMTENPTPTPANE